MKTLIRLLMIVSAVTLHAQISITPLNFAAAKHANDQITITNGSARPVAVTLSARTLGVVDGKLTVLTLAEGVKVKLHETSARIEPLSSHSFDYDIACKRCVTMVIASVTPIEKVNEDASVGMHISLNEATVAYVCEHAKNCRESFKDIFEAPK